MVWRDRPWDIPRASFLAARVVSVPIGYRLTPAALVHPGLSIGSGAYTVFGTFGINSRILAEKV